MKGNQIKEIPPLVLASAIVYVAVYRFFTPWYIRWWRSIKKRTIKIMRVHKEK